MSPYAIVIALVVLIGALVGGNVSGHRAGIAEQKAADQVLFDRINAELSSQKAEANAVYRAIQENNLKLVVERDQLKSNLEKEHAKNAATTDATRRDLAGNRLRFIPAEAAGSGRRGDSATGTCAVTAHPDGPATVELPATIASDLRQLVFEADKLADAYRECHGYAMSVQ